MTEDELMQLIIKADPRLDVPELYAYRHFERFADLVAAREREACAKRCERVADDYIAANGRHAAAIAYECAAAIRAGGET